MPNSILVIYNAKAFTEVKLQLILAFCFAHREEKFLSVLVLACALSET